MRVSIIVNIKHPILGELRCHWFQRIVLDVEACAKTRFHSIILAYIRKDCFVFDGLDRGIGGGTRWLFRRGRLADILLRMRRYGAFVSCDLILAFSFFFSFFWMPHLLPSLKYGGERKRENGGRDRHVPSKGT